jgi:protein involved in polysaccharide export with SLBB domain
MTSTRFLAILTLPALLAGCAHSNRQVPERAASPKPVPVRPLFHTLTLVETNAVVFVSGEVQQPGRFPWASDLSLTNALVLAGGFTDFAAKTRLEVRRPNGSIERYNYFQILRGLTNNPVLKQSDHLYVNRRWF